MTSREAFVQRCWAAGDALLQGKHPVVPYGTDITAVLREVSGVVNYDTIATDPHGGRHKVWAERLSDGSARLHIK